MKYLPTLLFAAVMLASVMPPDMRWACIWAIAVSGVTWMPFNVCPAVMLGSTAVITSPAIIGMVVPVASSTYVPPVICSITGPA